MQTTYTRIEIVKFIKLYWEFILLGEYMVTIFGWRPWWWKNRGNIVIIIYLIQVGRLYWPKFCTFLSLSRLLNQKCVMFWFHRTSIFLFVIYEKKISDESTTYNHSKLSYFDSFGFWFISWKHLCWVNHSRLF